MVFKHRQSSQSSFIFSLSGLFAPEREQLSQYAIRRKAALLNRDQMKT